MKKIYLIAAVILVTRPSVFLYAAADPAIELVSASGGRVWLTGSSTLHPYSSSSTLTSISINLSPEVIQSTVSAAMILADIALRAPFQKFDVVIPVKGLKSGEGGLDKNLYKALKSDQAPEIHFALTHYEASPAATDGSITFQASGQLSIAGVVKDIILKGTAHLASPELVMDGEYGLKMSDYGIKPPTLLLGAIKVADPVLIHFHLPFELSRNLSELINAQKRRLS